MAEGGGGEEEGEEVRVVGVWGVWGVDNEGAIEV